MGLFHPKRKNLYAHWAHPTIGHINLPGYEDKVKEVDILTTGKPAATVASWWGNSDEGNFFINVAEPTYQTFQLPDESNTVFRIILK